MNWSVTVEKIDNGYEVRWFEEGETENDKVRHHTIVFESDEDVKYGDAKSFAKMAWHLLSYFGNYGSRYDKERVRIKLEHGDKYECKDKKCEECNVL